ncbi:hypothetical protein [Bradyrhizobium sp. BWA-3-5]|uniref:hypothetical protein n=1 Tax=Bradyrhizobium sp. BWA-3-5 TaxID=3080013 RepID=UPI00293F2557|nr:hypothetical protein [Bradyrhizobium sp. BWA-3-5]WOH69470.1 hypothetical protein RX331_17980 [Bradyrhizobium sp. BWA-3-5]
MSKKRILLTLILSLGSTGALQANPLDSPGIVYIDGKPCNSACQSYMAWSAQSLSGRYREQHETNVAVPADAEIERPRHAGPARVGRQPARVSRAAPRAAAAASKARTSNTRKAAAPNPPAARKGVQAASAAAAAKPIAQSEAPEGRPEGISKPEPSQTAAVTLPRSAEVSKESVKETVTPELALPPPATLEIAARATPAATTSNEAPAPAPRTIQQQVVEATGMADLVTAIGTGQAPADKSANPETASGEIKDAGKAAAASSEDADNLVALVLARPEINSLSDLNNRNIAIEEKQSASSGRVSAALMAAGAPEVQFSEGQQGAVDRLIRGEVPAAVLTLASPQAAEWFPDIAGFRTFRVPLAQKARL